MKKLLIFLIGGLLLPLTVYADMGAPENMTYEVEVVNPKGANFYDYNCDYKTNNCKLVKKGIIPKGTKLTIYYEMYIDEDNYTSIYYNEQDVYINLSDTINISKEVTLEDENVNKLAKPIEKKVLVDNLKVYSSPAQGFKVIGTISKDTIIKATHTAGDTWFYVETPTIKGWIDSHMGTVGEYRKNNILLVRETELKDKNDNTIATIPANTKFSEYYVLDAWSMALFVTYEGKEGYVYDENVAYQNNNKVILLNNAKATKEFELSYECEENPKLCKDIITIPKNTELQQLYLFRRPRGAGNSSHYQVSYKNELYWIEEEPAGEDFFDFNFVAIIKNETISFDSETKVYNHPWDYFEEIDNEETNKEPIATIAKGEEIKLIYLIEKNSHNYGYIETKAGQKGWIYYYVEDEENIEETPEESEEIEIKEKGLSKNELLYICIGGAIVLTLTTIVIIIIISKKRKTQNQQNI